MKSWQYNRRIANNVVRLCQDINTEETFERTAYGIKLSAKTKEVMTAILRSLAEWLTEWKMKWAEISYPPVRMKGRVCVCVWGAGKSLTDGSSLCVTRTLVTQGESCFLVLRRVCKGNSILTWGISPGPKGLGEDLVVQSHVTDTGSNCTCREISIPHPLDLKNSLYILYYFTETKILMTQSTHLCWF